MLIAVAGWACFSSIFLPVRVHVHVHAVPGCAAFAGLTGTADGPVSFEGEELSPMIANNERSTIG